MPRHRNTITDSDNRIEASTRRRKKRLLDWLKKATKTLAANEINKVKLRELSKRAARREGPVVVVNGEDFTGELTVHLAKARSTKSLEDELLKILMVYGLRDIDAAGEGMHGRRSTGAATAEGNDDRGWAISPQLVQQVRRQKAVRVQDILKETRRQVASQVKAILGRADKEKPKPSVNEIARRIRTQVKEFRTIEGSAALESLANRAELIARTEAVQAENTGIAESMHIAGIEEIEWLAHSDGRSGDRHHERMKGEKIFLADSRSNDRSKWFKMPSGARLRYPGDPSGPISETARCRCTIVPVRRSAK